MKVPQIDKIKVTLTRVAARQYAVTYNRGTAVFVKANLKYMYDFNNRRKFMVEMEVKSSKQAFRQGKIRLAYDRDLQWLKVVPEIEITYMNRRFIKLIGTMKRNPSAQTLDISLKKKGKYFDGSVLYTRNWATKKAKLTMSVDKIEGIPQRYAVIFSVNAARFFKELNLKVDIPSRLFVLRKKMVINLSRRQYTREFELALNQRKGQRILVNYVSAKPNRRQKERTLSIKLPTRTLRWQMMYFKDGSDRFDWRNFRSNGSFSWDDNNPNKKSSASVKIVRNPGILFDATVNVKSFLMKRPLIAKVYAKKHSYRKSTMDLSLTAGQPSAAILNIIRERGVRGKDQVVTVKFSSKMRNNPMINFRAVADTQRMPGQQFLLGFGLNATAPSEILQAPLAIRWTGLYQRWRKLVLSSTTGASLMFDYKPQPFGSKLTLFLSNSRKEAARFTVSQNARKPNIKVQLDRGKGSLVIRLPLIEPYYMPNEARLKINIGLTDSNTAAILALIGPQNLAKSVSGWSKQTHDLGFFFLGAKLTPENLIKYAVKYRLGNTDRGTTMSKAINALYNVRTYLIAKVTSDPFIEKVGKLGRGSVMCVVRCVTENIDASRVTASMNEFVSNDYTLLKRYLNQMIQRNEFFSATYFSIYQSLKLKADAAIKMLKTRATSLEQQMQARLGGAVQTMRQHRTYLKSLVEGVWMRAQSFAGNAESLNFFFDSQRRLISTVLTHIDYSLERVRRLRDAARQSSSQMVMLAQAQMSRMLSEYPGVLAAYRKMSAYLRVKSNNMAASINRFMAANVVGPVTSSARFRQMVTQLQNIRYLFNQLRSGVASYNLLDLLPRNQRLVNFLSNHKRGMKLLMAGQVKQAFYTLTKLELCKVQKFELICPLPTSTRCKAAKWHATIEGQFYLPAYIPSFRFFGGRFVLGARSQISTLVRRLRNQGDQVYEYLTAKLIDTIAKVNRIRQMKGATPPFEASAYILGGGVIGTFDGRYFKVERDCSFVLTHDFLNNKFSVKASYTTFPEERFYDWQSVAVRSEDQSVTIMRNGEVKVNGALKDLPYMVPGTKLMATRMGDRVIVDHMRSRAFSVTCFIAQNFCRVSVGRWQYNGVAGLLGTNDNEPYNDMMLPTRKVVPDSQFSEFARSWTVGRCPNMYMGSPLDEYAPEPCAKLFRNSDSRFSRCFAAVDPAPLLRVCSREHSLKRNICKSAALYITQCQMKGIVLQMPVPCLLCRLNYSRWVGPGRFQVDTPPSGLRTKQDFIFVTEATQCVKNTLASIRTLSILLESSDTKFGLVMYGGRGRHRLPHQHTVGRNTLQSGGDDFRKSLAQAAPMYSSSAADVRARFKGMRALRYAAYSYPSLYKSGRSIILITCTKSVIGINEYAMASRYLRDRGVSVHVLTAGNFTQSREVVNVYGLSKTHVFTTRDKSKVGRGGSVSLGRTDLRRSTTWPKDLVTTLAMRTTGGAVWSLNKLSTNQPIAERRSMLRVMAGVIKKSTSTSACMQCRCGLQADNISSKLDCKLCERRTGFDFWLGDNFDS